MAWGNGLQSVLNPAGPQASSIHDLWLVMLWTSAAVFVAVLAFVAAALLRRGEARHDTLPRCSEQSLGRVVVGAVALTCIVLFGLLVASVLTSREVAALRADSAISISVTAHQWWWEVEYEDAQPSRRVLTANELHVPLRRPVVVNVTSRDVIHSLWMPNLQGKRDLIPGYTTEIWLQADQPGRYRGQCAEFCGLQHAHMALDVVAESDKAFEGWLDQLRQPARMPEGTAERQGRELFNRRRCASCHTIRGTEAAGQAAPDLTHVASRLTLGAGAVPNTPAHRRAWIRDPQQPKPGTQMPANPLPDEEMAALSAYLDTLR
jgi:cytochrome c oxidase subunit 2